MDDAAKQPYPGLRPFTKNESRIFFGRRRQCIQLLENLETQYFIAVTGQSGSGKSSLVKAGMIPLLERGSMPRDGRHWFTVETNPGEDPFGNLANALYKTFVTDHALFEITPDDIQSVIETGPLGILALLEQRSCIRVKTPGEQGSRKNLLLLIDQFEEIFSYCEKYGFDTADRYISLLLETARQQKFAIFIILTMRSDFLGKCCFFEGLPEAVSKGQFLVPKLNQDDLRAAIIGPQRYFGFSVHPDLITNLLNDYAAMEADFQRTQDLLPLMQHVLMRLYHFAQPDHDGRKELTVNLYHSPKIQGLSKALNLHADDVYDNLPTRNHKKAAQILFRRLTFKTQENSYVRSRAEVNEIIRLCFHSRSETFATTMDEADTAQMVKAVADTFRSQANCFLYPFLEKIKTLGGTEDLNITHESLIRCWDKCRQWADMEAREANLFLEIQKRGERSLHGEPHAIGKALKRYESWRKDAYHSAAWAQRYCKTRETCRQQYDMVLRFISKSRFRKKGKTFVGLVLLIIICMITYYYPAIISGISSHFKERGDIALEKKAFELAKSKYKLALRVNMLSGNPDVKFNIYQAWGQIYSEKNAYAEAITFYKEKRATVESKTSEFNELILDQYREYAIELLDHQKSNPLQTKDIWRKIIQELEQLQSTYETGQIEISKPSKQGKSCLFFLLGLAHQEINKLEEADHYYDTALENLAATDTYKLLAQAYYKWGTLNSKKNPDTAADRLIAAALMQPNRHDYILAAANALYKSEKYDEAIRYFNKIINEEPGIKAGKNIGLAFCYQSKGEKDKAQKYLEAFKTYALLSGGENIKKRINDKVHEFNAIQ